MSIMHPFGLSLATQERADSIIKIILKGWKKACHRRCHQFGKVYPRGTFGPFSLSLLSASVKLKPAQIIQIQISKSNTKMVTRSHDFCRHSILASTIKYIYIYARARLLLTPFGGANVLKNQIFIRLCQGVQPRIHLLFFLRPLAPIRFICT